MSNDPLISSAKDAHVVEVQAAPNVMVVPVKPLSRVQTSSASVGDDWLASMRSVQPVASVGVVSSLNTAAIVTLPVRAFWFNAGAGVPPVAISDCEPPERTANDPTLGDPDKATHPTVPLVSYRFAPIAGGVEITHTRGRHSDRYTLNLEDGRLLWARLRKKGYERF